MKTQYFDYHGQHLIVYFAGWGTPPSAVGHLLAPQNYDVLLCYDYRQLHCEFDFTAYRQIRLVAWSMGVWAAERVMAPYALTSATAINGTGLPCDDRFGIPRDIFAATVVGLNAANRLKFERRMCGNQQTFSAYQQLAARPTQAQIEAELTALYQALQQDSRTDLIDWTHALIGNKDKIFPARNQRRYWQQRCPIREIDGEHLLFPQFHHWAQCWDGTE